MKFGMAQHYYRQQGMRTRRRNHRAAWDPFGRWLLVPLQDVPESRRLHIQGTGRVGCVFDVDSDQQAG